VHDASHAGAHRRRRHRSVAATVSSVDGCPPASRRSCSPRAARAPTRRGSRHAAANVVAYVDRGDRIFADGFD
jgi:hypothetical protein